MKEAADLVFFVFLLLVIIACCCYCCPCKCSCTSCCTAVWRRLRGCVSSVPYYHVRPLGSSTRGQFRAAFGEALRTRWFRQLIDAYDQTFFWTPNAMDHLDVKAKLRMHRAAFFAKDLEAAALVRRSSILILVDDSRRPLLARQLAPLINVSTS